MWCENLLVVLVKNKMFGDWFAGFVNGTRKFA